MNTVINSFLTSVIQTYGHGQAIKIPANSPQTNSVDYKKSPKGSSIGARIFRRLRKFSKKSVENMMKMSNLGNSIPLANVKSPRSSKIPWATLKRVLTRGIRGPDVARKGVVNFARSKYALRKDDIARLQKTAAIKSVSQLKEDNTIPAYIMPLRGDENSFQYKSDTCEYIVQAAVGRQKKKSARAMCRKWKRTNRRKLKKRL